MLPEDVIREELDAFARWASAYRSGKRGNALPALPRPPEHDRMTPHAFLGLLLHPVFFMVSILGRRAGFNRLLRVAAKVRVATDNLSFEPAACGLNNAYTNLGLALLALGDLAGAIECLDASWRVHPCPHNTSYGLKQQLIDALELHREAHQAVARYREMSRLFRILER